MYQKRRMALLILMLICLPINTSFSATTLGNHNSVLTDRTDAFHYTHLNPYYQSFTTSYDNIVGAGFFLADWNNDIFNDTLTISIYDSIGSAPIASGSVTASENSWAEVYFTQTALTIGNEYYLLAQSTLGLLTNFNTGLYTEGQVYDMSGYVYAESMGWDMTFRTYYDDGQVPVPSAFLLLASGLLGIVGVKKNKR